MISNNAIMLAVTFLWLGFVGAISFMEAWLKFRAPGITLPLGLGIGRMVFHALNIMEWLFLLIILINLYFNQGLTFRSFNIWLAVPVLTLILQTVWVLPVLDARAELHIQGMEVPPLKIHFIYVLFEILKVGSLFTFGIQLFKKSTI